VREIPRAGVLLLGNHIRVTIRTNTRCGTSNIPHTPTGNKWFSESISGLLGQPVPTSTVYPIPVRAPSCSRTISGLLYEQIPAAGNQSSRTHNATSKITSKITNKPTRYIMLNKQTPSRCKRIRSLVKDHTQQPWALNWKELSRIQNELPRKRWPIRCWSVPLLLFPWAKSKWMP
jgi:hypothetical protein